MHSTIKCNFENCSQVYNNVYCLKRHILSNHINNSRHLQRISTAKNAERKEIISQLTINSVHDYLAQERISIIDIISSTCNEGNNMDIIQVQEKINTAATLVVAKLYAYRTLNRTVTNDIIQTMSSFYNSVCLPMLKIKYNNIDGLQDILQIIETAFDNFKTEYSTFKYLKSIGCLIMPSIITIDTSIIFGPINKKKKSFTCHKNISIIPLKSVLIKFLELPNVFSTITVYIERCKNDNNIITSIIQSSFWKSTVKDSNSKIVLPLILFSDDIEINNPLGSHKGIHKLGAVYCTIPCIPEEYSSRLENIFLLQLHNSVDHKHLGNKKIFNKVIEVIIDLEVNGIQIKINGEVKMVFFKLCFIAGDNLGLNTMLGFSRSFNSTYCCRICLIAKQDIQKQVRENPNLIRTVTNYTDHCKEKIFGIDEECIFNSIPSFHVAENFSVDPMHDLLEGVCRYDIGKILKNFIVTNQRFTLEIFNERLRYFKKTSFGENIPVITQNLIEKEYLIISSSEMKYLVLNLCLIIGDIIPVNNVIWELYLILRQIVCIVFLHAVNRQTVDLLEVLVFEYLSLHGKLFPNSLKYKHHNLLHYPRIMRTYGSLKNMTCTRFEAKHLEIKENSKICKTRVNPSFTLSLKHQLQLCYRFLCNQGFTDDISVGTIVSKLYVMSNYDCLRNLLPHDSFKDYECITWIIINGNKYDLNSIICISNDNEPAFAKVKHIVISPSKEVFFLYTTLITVCHNRHLCAFEVYETQKWSFVSQKDLMDCTVYYVKVMSDEKHYIPTYF